jgi:hypothetical protein
MRSRLKVGHSAHYMRFEDISWYLIGLQRFHMNNSCHFMLQFAKPAWGVLARICGNTVGEKRANRKECWKCSHLPYSWEQNTRVWCSKGKVYMKVWDTHRDRNCSRVSPKSSPSVGASRGNSSSVICLSVHFDSDALLLSLFTYFSSRDSLWRKQMSWQWK